MKKPKTYSSLKELDQLYEEMKKKEPAKRVEPRPTIREDSQADAFVAAIHQDTSFCGGKK